MLLTREGKLTAQGGALVLRCVRAAVTCALTLLFMAVLGGVARADLMIAVPSISTADIATITAWVGGMVIIAVSARFILVNAFVVVRFIGWIISGAFRWARG